MSKSLVISDPEIMGGTPVIRGTRVPVSTLFDYLMDGMDVDEFLDHFLTGFLRGQPSKIKFTNEYR